MYRNLLAIATFLFAVACHPVPAPAANHGPDFFEVDLGSSESILETLDKFDRIYLPPVPDPAIGPDMDRWMEHLAKFRLGTLEQPTAMALMTIISNVREAFANPECNGASEPVAIVPIPEAYKILCTIPDAEEELGQADIWCLGITGGTHRAQTAWKSWVTCVRPGAGA